MNGPSIDHPLTRVVFAGLCGAFALAAGARPDALEIRPSAAAAPVPVLAAPAPDAGGAFAATNRVGDLVYSLGGESAAGGGRKLVVSVENRGPAELAPRRVSLRLGIDTVMATYPGWNSVHFPSFLSCENGFFWGYAMSPDGDILGIFSPDAVASWHLGYNNGGHRIDGIFLDLLDSEAGSMIAAGEKRTWRVTILPVPSLDAFPAAAARALGRPVATARRYTLLPCETPALDVAEPGGESAAAPVPRVSGSFGSHSYTVPGGNTVTFIRRRPWSWYLARAREWAVRSQQKASSNMESWLGFFPAYEWRESVPESGLDAAIDARFDSLFALMYPDPGTMAPAQAVYPGRIQNHAAAASLYALRYRVLRRTEDLEKAAKLADYVLKYQHQDGGYYSGASHNAVHYTCVTYIAGYLMDVMRAERGLAGTGTEWKARYDRHFDSVRRAMDDLARRRDDIKTEGEMTFEDGMISCAYSQLAAWALDWAPKADRARYVEAAEALVAKHRCLSQLVQPDGRRHGGSLRFWESQYDILSFKNMMSSPHGWSAWRLYGLVDLYRLTGKVAYLRDAMDGMGACANLIDPVTGQLSWAVQNDPQIEGTLFRADPVNPGRGIREAAVSRPGPKAMVSTWWKAPEGKIVFGYNWRFEEDDPKNGGSCDNDVFEVYKCLAEKFVRTTFVVLAAKAPPEAYNGVASAEDGVLTVVPAEPCVEEIHFNASAPCEARVLFQGRPPRTVNLPAGLSSITR